MIRKIIHIDEEKCNGCGLCAEACHEGAIDIVDGKAKLMRENFCDGFGDCLPNCPTGAISFEEREAPEYDHEAVKKAQEDKKFHAYFYRAEVKQEEKDIPIRPHCSPHTKTSRTWKSRAGNVPRSAKCSKKNSGRRTRM